MPGKSPTPPDRNPLGPRSLGRRLAAGARAARQAPERPADSPPRQRHSPPRPGRRQPGLGQRIAGGLFLFVLGFSLAGAGLGYLVWVYLVNDPEGVLLEGVRETVPMLALPDARRQQAQQAAALPAGPRPPLTLYFTEDGQSLVAQTQELPENVETQERLRWCLENLLRGPMGDRLHSAVPGGTRLRGAYRLGDEVVIDLSENIREDRAGGLEAEWLCAQALAATALDNSPGARALRILIEGRPAELLWRDVDLSIPLLRDAAVCGPPPQTN